MRKALAAILAVILLIGSVCAGMWLVDFHSQQQEQEVKILSLRKRAVKPAVTDISREPTEPGTMAVQEAPVQDNLHNFAALQAENPDCIGWISIPNTPIDFPVMQSRDKPEFYLKHDFDREYDVYGLPFLDARCSLDSGNLLLYGHHMNDGSMFSCLHKYTDSAYRQEHPDIVFETLAGSVTYRVAAVLRVKGSYPDDEWSIFQCIDFNSLAAEEFLAQTSVEVAPGDKLLTLVTCEYSQKNGRLAVIAVKQ